LQPLLSGSFAIAPLATSKPEMSRTSLANAFDTPNANATVSIVVAHGFILRLLTKYGFNQGANQPAPIRTTD
jgi:hypothetical protein